jgi:protein-tyrosine phosphatase
MFENILIICVGNICRSPMGEGLLKHYASQHHVSVKISSAGIDAMTNCPADSNSIEIMQQRGIDISQHRAQQLTREHLIAADLVLVMESWQQKEIGARFPSAYGKVHRIGKWESFEISDPYQKGMPYFEHCYALIEQGLQSWVKKIWGGNV